MKRHSSGKTKEAGLILRMAAYLLAVLAVCIAAAGLCRINSTPVPTETPGYTDLTMFDFDSSVARVVSYDTNSAWVYPNAFYHSEDFREGSAPSDGFVYGSAGRRDRGEYGTLRIVLRLPPGQIYAIAAKNASYAQRLLIDGKDSGCVGLPGKTLESIEPKTARYITAFQPGGETTEIIIHYSNLVYSDGGGVYPIEIGLVPNMVRNEQLRTFLMAAVSAALVVALLFFSGLFLLSPGSHYLLWFGMICGSISLRGLFIGDKVIMVLLPDLDWHLAIRLELLLTICVALFSGCYLYSLFLETLKRWLIISYSGFCIAVGIIVCTAQPVIFSYYIIPFLCVCAVFGIYSLAMVIAAALQRKLVSRLSRIELRILLTGLAVYAFLAVIEIFAHQYSIVLFGLDFTQAGMILFFFLNVLVMSLGYARTEQELSAAQQKEKEVLETNQMLERLNKVKMDFLGNISHEMKTPLAVMSNCAGLTLSQIRKGVADSRSERNLDIIQREAVRLGRLAEQLIQVSMEEERRLTLIDSDVRAMLQRAADVCTPFCRSKGNCVAVSSGPDISLRINEDGIFQVLVNLITNANRHMENGCVHLDAVSDEKTVTFTVTDEGDGIAPDMQERAFRSGTSGDGGTGLGLAICREIIEEHGGDITMENIGSGTQVCFTIPRPEGGTQYV